ncbi:hypothetical protein PV396_39425 [Streptomyces sp. ME02-8801-2C]|uniref:hypothetical protein n=1 Tax=Streptomyces sp. ME02-8801-2C TaxID=3028680 RepID=UPI0029BACC24|nr:hypothetical protein [Streptomyces sp. ME02-8801-2C]MDX3457955.1 hypothetical protein [Streptomyces sp. ME02-8801-2C]
MSDAQSPATELTSHYAAQVAGDLERNAKEQDRVTAEIDALHEQLRALRHDHTVLTSMQQALGATGTTPEPAADATASPSVPQQKTASKPRAVKPVRAAKKTAAAQGGDVVEKPAAKNPEAATKAKAAKTKAKANQPTLVELIRRHLVAQKEPRSAAEIADALGQAHPERGIKATVVRTTVEGLVAKSHAQRTKQGSSVYYTTTDTPAPTAPAAPPADDLPATN